MSKYLMIQDNKIINIFVWNGQGFLPFPPTINVQEVTDPQTQTIGNYIFDGIGYSPSDILQLEIDTNLTSPSIENDETVNPTPDPDNLATANNQFKIPTLESGNYSNIVIDWGDGVIDTSINEWNDPRLVHTYETAGAYTIKIFLGVFDGFSFGFGGDKDKIININQLGAVNLGLSGDSFQACTHLINVSGILNTTNTSNFNNMFSNCLSLKTFDSIGNWDISTMLNANEMFKNVDLSVDTYDALLTGWGNQTPQNDIIFDGGLSKYSTIEAELKRNNLINNFGWTITDGGKVT